MTFDPRDLVDEALELLVLPSFSRIGYDLRRRMYEWEDVGRVSLRGRTALVTGPTSGLGRTTVSHLAAMGARVLLVGRDPDRLERTRLELEAWSGNHEIATYVADLGLAGRGPPGGRRDPRPRAAPRHPRRQCRGARPGSAPLARRVRAQPRDDGPRAVRA